MSADNLQEIVDGIRTELKKGFGGDFVIRHPHLREPLTMRVTVDGATAWLVRITCGRKVLIDTGHAMCFHPDEFMNDLYVIIRRCIRSLTTPAPESAKPS